MERLDRAIVRLNAALHYAAALWLFGLAVVILLDVAGRGLFNAPLQGTAEIVANSVVSIAFLQLCHAVAMAGLAMLNYLTMAFLAAARREARAVP